MKTDTPSSPTTLERAGSVHPDGSRLPAGSSSPTLNSESVSGALNAAQVRAVAAALRTLEYALDEVERLLASTTSGVTIRWRVDLTVEEHRLLRQLTAQLRGRLAVACLDLGIGADERSVRGAIRGTLAVLWATLEDSRAVSLRSYGPLPAGAGLGLDATMAALAADVGRILRIVEGTEAGARGRDRGAAGAEA